MGEIKDCSLLTWDMFRSLDDKIRERRRMVVILSKMAISLNVQVKLNVSGFEALDQARERRKEMPLITKSKLPQSKIDDWL